MSDEGMRPTWRVMTWNLWWRHGDWAARQPAILAVLRDVDADVVAIQEGSTAEPDHPAALRELGYHVVAAPDGAADQHGIVNLVASRWPVRGHDWTYLDVGDAPPHRTVLRATLEAPFGEVDIWCTHLSHGFDQSALRQIQLRQIAVLVAAQRAEVGPERPQVLLGDLNAVPDSDEIRMLTGRSAAPADGLIFSDAWAVVGEGPGLTWSRDNPYLVDSAWPDRRLDYVMTGWPRPRPSGNPAAAFLAGTAPVRGRFPSDHFGVAVDLFV